MMTDTPKIVRWKVWKGATDRASVFRKEYTRETAHRYVFRDNHGRERLVVKQSNYDLHFDTEQEALDYVAANRAAREERAAAQRVRDAAPDLLAALEGVVAGYRMVAANPPEWLDAARAAIAKAKGEA